MSIRGILLAGLVLWMSPRPAKAQEPVAIPPTHRVLVPLLAWERGSFGGFNEWFAAMASAGYKLDCVDKVPDLSARELLERYDAIVMTTRSPSIGVLEPRFEAATEEFVRQGGGLILVQTAGQESFIGDPINLILPTTFYDTRGVGWNTRSTLQFARPLPTNPHPTTTDIDWKSAPPLTWMMNLPPPDDELFRGAMQLIEPRQGLVKPLLNNNWNVVLRGDDTEHSPLAVTSNYGRGHILLWGALLGHDQAKNTGITDFTKWDGFAPVWAKLLTWTAGAGKVAAPQPAVWIVGDAIDNPAGVAWNGQRWAFWRNLSYALPDFGLSLALSPDDAGGALVLKADSAKETALVQIANAGKPLMVCDPAAWTGALKPFSPLSENILDAPILPPFTVGTAVIAPSATAPTPAVTPVLPVTDIALQPPRNWKLRATGSEVFDRDLREKWYASDYDSDAFQIQPLGPISQDIGGKPTGYDGAIWYRAMIDIPTEVSGDAVWRFTGPVEASLRAWSNGTEVPLERFNQPGVAGWLLRLKSLKRGSQLLALRLYKSAYADYWSGSRNLYSNTGLTAVSAELRPFSPQPAAVFDMSSPTIISQPVLSKLAPTTPLLFSSRADGDKYFHLTFTATAEAAAREPLLMFDEPGLIRQVRVNDQVVTRIGQGAWDGVSGGNTSAFLLRGVLRAGENTLDFRPDFSRFRNLDYPVADEVRTRCSLPRIEWTGDLQTLEAADGALASYVPNRLFKPGAVRAPAPGARVLLRWNDGRPALVRRGNVLAWTSDIVAQLNAAQVHNWQLTVEAMWNWDSNAADTVPRGDSLLWENAAPLLCAALAQAFTEAAPQITGVRPLNEQHAVEVDIENAGPARATLLSYRILNWQGAIVSTGTKPIALAGMTKSILAIPLPGFAGEAMKPEWLVMAALRSPDNSTGFSYLEKVVEMPPPVRVTIADDSPLDRFAAGALPDKLARSPGYRGRQLWWPQLNEDPGSSVFLDGETAHLRVLLHNESGVARTLPVTIEVRAQSRGVLEKRLQQTVQLPPDGRQALEIDTKLTGDFEPYLVSVRAGDEAREETRVLYAVQPWKHNVTLDNPPRSGWLSFDVMLPFSYLQQPDNILPEAVYDINTFTFASTVREREWLMATDTDTIGNGGGVLGFEGVTEGFGWGPFDRSQFNNAPNQMSLLGNGEPMMHYIADGMQRRHAPPSLYEIVDFWGNFSVPFNWNSLAAFRDWLAVTHPAKLAEFVPSTRRQAEEKVRTILAPEWNEWQSAVVIGSWSAVKDTTAPGSLFWDQAEHAIFLANGWPSAASGKTDGMAIGKFFGDLIAAGDADPGTSRMGLGYRYRSNLETTAAALAPNMHFNVSSLRHVDGINEQRMGNSARATPETYRSYAYDTAYSASVKPDGTLRSVVDTPVSEILTYPNPSFSGLKYGNILYDRIYRLASVVEPQKALGVLWVAPIVARADEAVDTRLIYETLRNNGVPLSATISPEYLMVAPHTGATGLVYLLPKRFEAEELKSLNVLATAKFPVVCLVSSATEGAAAQLPAGFIKIELPTEFSRREVGRLAASINEATGSPLTASPGICVYGFGAIHRGFFVAQNMCPERREVEVDIEDKAAGLASAVRAVNLNDNSVLAVNRASGRSRVTISLGPWDAALVLLSSGATP